MRRGHLYNYAQSLGCNKIALGHHCDNEENRSKRIEVKELIRTLKQTNPFVEGNIFKSVENVNLDTVVAYKQSGERHHFLDTYDSK